MPARGKKPSPVSSRRGRTGSARPSASREVRNPSAGSEVERQLAALQLIADDPSSAPARETLRATLREGASLAAGRAARIVRDRMLEGFFADLEVAFRRFLSDPVKRDPGCVAKLAALEALDYGGARDADVFLQAIRVFQREPAWGPPVDTAVGVRGRGILALARLDHPDFSSAAGALLADEASPVRQAAAEAIGSTADRRFAGLLVLRWTLGDDDPLVVMACMTGLLALAPDDALARLRAALDGPDEAAGEMAALVLGQATTPATLELLLAQLAAGEGAPSRKPVLRALGLRRDDSALAAVLAVIAHGLPGDAQAAIEGLGARRFDARVREQARAAAAQNAGARLDAALAAAFPSDDSAGP
jgi:HEAT repeat protein